MIKSCEDIKTLDEFEELMESTANASRMGLQETVYIVCWSKGELIDPELFTALYELYEEEIFKGKT